MSSAAASLTWRADVLSGRLKSVTLGPRRNSRQGSRPGLVSHCFSPRHSPRLAPGVILEALHARSSSACSRILCRLRLEACRIAAVSIHRAENCLEDRLWNTGLSRPAPNANAV